MPQITVEEGDLLRDRVNYAIADIHDDYISIERILSKGKRVPDLDPSTRHPSFARHPAIVGVYPETAEGWFDKRVMLIYGRIQERDEPHYGFLHVLDMYGRTYGFLDDKLILFFDPKESRGLPYMLGKDPAPELKVLPGSRRRLQIA